MRHVLLQLHEISAGRGVRYLGADTLVDFKQVLLKSVVLPPKVWSCEVL